MSSTRFVVVCTISNLCLIMKLLFLSWQKTGEVSLLLRRAREEEKLLRRSFTKEHGHHFILTLFPELQDRVPNITVCSTKHTYMDSTISMHAPFVTGASARSISKTLIVC